MDTYKQGELVLIHSVNDSGDEYQAIIEGVSVAYPNVIFWIVRPLNSSMEKICKDYPYDCLVVIGSCIKPFDKIESETKQVKSIR